jgi:hypothetical protein
MLQPGQIADVIDIILFKYNYIDNRLFSLCKKHAYRKYDDGSIVVPVKTVVAVVEKFFEKELISTSMMPSDQAYKSANTIFFIDKLFLEMPNIKWIKMTLNTNRIYSRVVDQPELGPTIKFTFKIIHCTIKLYEYFNEDEIKIFNKYIEPLGLFKEKPYARISTMKLIDQLEMAIETNVFSENSEILIAFLDLFDMKLENDNPDVLLITDY